ncbi:hypothetical protein, partial [Streptomyces anthocyanicus]
SVPKQPRVAAATAAAGTCHPWVTVRYYDGDNGTGSSINLYCDYTNLGSVGWDNRVNSITCMVCSAVTVPTKTMQSFQGYNYSILMQQTMSLTTHNAAVRNGISSNRLAFG